MIDRSPPNDLELERAALACILLDNGSLPRMAGVLRPADFYADRHRVMYETALTLAAEGMPIDPVTLGGRLRDLGQLDRVGGAAVFNDILNAGGFASHAESYAAKIRRYAVVRGILRATQEVQAQCYAGIGEFDQFVSDSRSTLSSALNEAHSDTTEARKLDALFREIYCDLEKAQEPAGLVRSGFENFDRVAGGFWPGLVTVLAARPSMGKTAVGLNIATNAALAGKRTMIFSLEDTAYFLAVRQLGRFGEIDTQLLTMRCVPTDQYSRVLNGLQRASGLPLWVDDSPSIDVAQIRARVLRHRDKHGLDFLVIDHLLEIAEKGENETQIVAHAMRGVRDLAKELHIPILLLHQLNRKVEDRANKIPVMSDLKQSGKIEEAARNVLFLFRPGYYDNDDTRHDIQLHIAKANHGRTGMVTLWAHLPHMFVRGWDATTDGPVPGVKAETSTGDDQPRKSTWRKADGTPVHEVRPYKEDDY